jgi:hypothetical protein
MIIELNDINDTTIDSSLISGMSGYLISEDNWLHPSFEFEIIFSFGKTILRYDCEAMRPITKQDYFRAQYFKDNYNNYLKDYKLIKKLLIDRNLN